MSETELEFVNFEFQSLSDPSGSVAGDDEEDKDEE